MTKPKKVHGKVRGVEVTEEAIDEMAKEAEAGYDVDELRRRGPRPRDTNMMAKSIVDQATELEGTWLRISGNLGGVKIEKSRFESRAIRTGAATKVKASREPLESSR